MAARTNLALTGVSGVGKSTLLHKVSRSLPAGVVARGFVSRSIVERGVRVGWRLDAFGGHGGVFVHRALDTPHRFGEYGVDMGLLDDLVDLELTKPGAADVFIIDEIGPVCAASPSFVAAVTAVLDSSVRTISAVHRIAPGFPAEVRERDDVALWKVTHENRDTMLAEVLAWGGWLSDTVEA